MRGKVYSDVGVKNLLQSYSLINNFYGFCPQHHIISVGIIYGKKIWN